MALRLPAGAPLAEANRMLHRSRQRAAIPTGDALTSISSPWIAALTGGAAHTKGSYVELTPASTVDCYGLRIAITQTSVSTTNTSALLDIAVGGAGSEVDVIPNVGVGYKASFGTAIGFFPVFIPAGSRVSARVQGAEASKAITVVALPAARQIGSTRPSTKVVTMGADTATSKGVNVTVASTNTKGSWSQIIASTAEPFTGLGVSMQGGADTTLATGFGLADIGIGSAGNEVVIVPNLAISFSVQEAVSHYEHGAFHVAIPAGSRLAARAAFDSTANTIDVILHGIR